MLQEFLGPDEIDLVMASQPAFLQAFLGGTDVIEGIPTELTDKLVNNLSLTASTDNLDKLKSELLSYRDAGLNSVSLRLYKDPAESIELLAQEFLPLLA